VAAHCLAAAFDDHCIIDFSDQMLGGKGERALLFAVAALFGRAGRFNFR